MEKKGETKPWLCVCIISSKGAPIYSKIEAEMAKRVLEIEDMVELETRVEGLIFDVLDDFNDKEWAMQELSNETRAWLGLLSSREEIDFFGYRTGSKQKIIILAPRGAVEEEMEMAATLVFRTLTEVTMNPFQEIDSPIQSETFDKRIDSLLISSKES